jgi:hypothetical protein
MIDFFNKHLMVDDFAKIIIRSHLLEGWVLPLYP